MALKIELQDNKFRVITQEFKTQWLPDTESNRKVMVIALRYLVDEKGRSLFEFKELAAIVESRNRQAASEHVEKFRRCGEDFHAWLTRKRKVNDELVECVRACLLEEPLLKNKKLAEQANRKLGRQDISSENIQAALAQIGCDEIRQVLRKRLEKGQVHYKESYLMEEMMRACPNEAGIKAGLNIVEQAEGMKLVDPTAIRTLLTPDVPMGEVRYSLGWMTFMINLYYWGTPLAVLGRWFNVNKTTVLRWIISLSLALWAIIYPLILAKVKATKVYIDEKWVKIRGRWHYWFVVLDVDTLIPVCTELLVTRTSWAVRWLAKKLKSIKKIPQVIITDGLKAYQSVFFEAKHLLCRFHHQQDVTHWLNKHFSTPEEIQKRKPIMKKMLQTNDKRTARRRLHKLEEKAPGLKITGWVRKTKSLFSHLLYSIGSTCLPSTTNAIERFFRAFNRFYKTRRNFCSQASAKHELILFLVVYLFTIQDNGRAPIEKIVPEACRMPFYRLLNDPFASLPQLKIVKRSTEMANFLLPNSSLP